MTGLAILSSDALSSVAYATEEILRVLMIGGVAALSLVTPIGLVIAAMLADRGVLLPPDDPRLSRAAAARISSPRRTSAGARAWSRRRRC